MALLPTCLFQESTFLKRPNFPMHDVVVSDIIIVSMTATVKCDKKGYTITSDHDGSVVKLAFNQQEKSWAVQVNDDEPITFMTFVDDTHVKMYTPSGEFQTVELSEQGLFAYQQYIQAVNSLAMK